MFRFISIVMIVATVIFAIASAFIFRTRSSAVRARMACTGIQIVFYEVIAVVMLEIFRVGYITNIYTAEEMKPDTFGYLYMVICSICAVILCICWVIAVREDMKWRLISAAAIAFLGIGLPISGYFSLRSLELNSEKLTNEYSGAALPVLIGFGFTALFAATNILLSSERKWMRVVMAFVNIINIAAYVTALWIMLGWVREISEGSSEGVYIAVIIGIIIILPSIICMCSVFGDGLATSKAKK